MQLKIKTISLLGLLLVCSSGLRAQAFLANYGIPFAAETTLEAIRDLSKTACGVGPQAYICQYVAGFFELQKNNIQAGFSKHLQEKVASGAQSIYNQAFGPIKAESVTQFQASMEQFRKASTKTQSTQSIKSRMNMAQWLPIFDALYELGTDKALAYAVFLIGVFLPEYNGDEPELALKPQALFAANRLSIAGIKQQLQAEIYQTWVNEDSKLTARFERILAAWQGIESAAQEMDMTSSQAGQMAAGTGFLIAPTLKLIDPKLLGISGNSLLTSLTQNMAEATTRAYALDAAAHARLLVQSAGGNKTSVSYQTLQNRQNALTQMWSELGLTMQANLWRYLAMIIPGFVQVAREPDLHQKAAMLASILSYIRRYDPEYPIEDRFLQMTFEAILGGFEFLTPELKEAFEGNLRWLDPDFNQDTRVQAYYTSILSPFCPMPVMAETKVPVASMGLSWGVQWAYMFLKETVFKKMPEFFKETFERASSVVILGVGDPAKFEIQQSINDAIRPKSNAESVLSAGAVQLLGRLGIDAQMARAIYERLVPTFSHMLDAARESYKAGHPQKAARSLVYLSSLISEIYPEAPTNDQLIADLIRVRFTQFVDPNSLKTHLEDLLSHQEPVLACFMQQRLFAAGLLNENCESHQEAVSEWSYYLSPTGLAYVATTGLAYALPGLVAWKLPKELSNRPATYAWLGAKSLVVTNVYLGITKGPLDWIKSQAQLWTQYQYINGWWGQDSFRVDEDSTWGKSRDLFSGRQRTLLTYLNSDAQEGRKDLIVILGNWALNFRKTQPDYTTFEEFIQTPFGKHYAEAKEVLRPYFERMSGNLTFEGNNNEN